jgi:hypothetical protein
MRREGVSHNVEGWDHGFIADLVRFTLDHSASGSVILRRPNAAPNGLSWLDPAEFMQILHFPYEYSAIPSTFRAGTSPANTCSLFENTPKPQQSGVQCILFGHEASNSGLT